MRKIQAQRYRLIAALLQYPDSSWLETIPDINACLERLPRGRSRETLVRFLDYLASQPLLHLQEKYTTVFDLNPSTTLNMSYHLFGDGRKRAAMLLMLQHNYRCAGYDGPAHDLPDFLPAMVEFLGVCRDTALRDAVWRCFGGLDGLVHRLRDAAPAYADLLDLLAEDHRHWQKIVGDLQPTGAMEPADSIEPRP